MRIKTPQALTGYIRVGRTSDRELPFAHRDHLAFAGRHGSALRGTLARKPAVVGKQMHAFGKLPREWLRVAIHDRSPIVALRMCATTIGLRRSWPSTNTTHALPAAASASLMRRTSGPS
jgi:hypothetical protein